MSQHPVTDHALIRYCERAKSIDMDWIRDQIATPELRAAIEAGARSYIQDGLRFKIRDGRIITVSKIRTNYTPTKRQKRRAIRD